MGELVVEEVKKSGWSKEKSYEIVDGPHVLGTYSTEEKALKTLDRVQAAHDDFMYHPSITTAFGVRQEFAYTQPKTFQMPGDDEV